MPSANVSALNSPSVRPHVKTRVSALLEGGFMNRVNNPNGRQAQSSYQSSYQRPSTVANAVRTSEAVSSSKELSDTISDLCEKYKLGVHEEDKALNFSGLKIDHQLTILYINVLSIMKSQDKVCKHISEKWEPEKNWVTWVEEKCDMLLYDPHATKYMYSQNKEMPALAKEWMRENITEGVDASNHTKVTRVKHIISKRFTTKRSTMKAELLKVRRTLCSDFMFLCFKYILGL